MLGTTAVFAKVTHIGLDYATVKLTAEIVSNNPENTRPSVEIEVPRGVGEWLERVGAYQKPTNKKDQ